MRYTSRAMPGETPLNEARAKQLLATWGGHWYGPPKVIDARTGHVVDGRTRTAAWNSVNVGEPPTLRLRSDSAIAHVLILANHYDRARRYIPAAILDGGSFADLRAFLGTDNETLAPFWKRKPKRERSIHATAKRRNAIERVARLIGKAQETTGTVSIHDLRKAIEPWL
jgi:hypothetical protein